MAVVLAAGEVEPIGTRGTMGVLHLIESYAYHIALAGVVTLWMYILAGYAFARVMAYVFELEWD